ncbi:MAG: hypothetical protein JKY55_20940 [Aliivibrio sp.]|uniref:hypothetical protein n=1 Tax=Aliivibrio sp. TaxID=1872443 RepID=UPI001A61057D|nr:hypothetical protein [Aliivibrio sp.]
MIKPDLTGSASVHKSLGAFGGLFTILSIPFSPVVAFVLTSGVYTLTLLAPVAILHLCK